MSKNVIKTNWIQSCQHYHRRLNLALFFSNLNATNLHPSIPKTISTWEPPRQNYSYKLESYIKYITNRGLDVITKTLFKRCRVDQLLVTILKKLFNNPNIIIKPSDKNLGLVLMDKNSYLQMCYKHLNDTNTYKRVEEKEIKDKIHWCELKTILITSNLLYADTTTDIIDNANRKQRYSKLAESLLQLEPTTVNVNNKLREAVFYGLPKMHKGGDTVRPIISAPGTMTYFASVHINKLLTPILKLLPTICPSSKSVLDEIRRDNPTRLLQRNSVILTADVNSLYPSIPIDAGIQAVNELLTYLTCDNKFIQYVCEMLNWILRHNYCTFNNEFFLQILGTAMGTPVAPTYAQIFLYMIERKHLNTFFCTLYKRYIDDIFALFESRQHAIDFVKSFNESYPTIKLDEASVHIKQSGIFLDLEFTIVHDSFSLALQHKIFQKPANKYSYIPACSNHKPTVFISFIKEELRRYKRSCSLDSDFLSTAYAFKTRLQARGYSADIFINALQSLNGMETRNSKNRVPVICTNNTIQAQRLLNDIFFPDSPSPEPPKKRNRPSESDRVIFPPLPEVKYCRKLFFVNSVPATAYGHFPFKSILSLPASIDSLPSFTASFESNRVIVGHQNSKSIASYLIRSKT